MIDPSWNKIHAEREWGRWPPEEIVSIMCRTWKPGDRRGVKVLDLGCGAGAVAWFLAYEGWQVMAIDGSEESVTRCTYRLSRDGLLIPSMVLQVDFTERLPFENDGFDAVIDNLSLCHNPMPDIINTLVDIKRVLKPGGLLVSRMFGNYSNIDLINKYGEVTLIGSEYVDEIFSDWDIVDSTQTCRRSGVGIVTVITTTARKS